MARTIKARRRSRKHDLFEEASRCCPQGVCDEVRGAYTWIASRKGKERRQTRSFKQERATHTAATQDQLPN